MAEDTFPPTLTYAPWTARQVEALMRRQRDEHKHAYTCPNHSTTPLAPTQKGWSCVYCDYKQNWAHTGDTQEIA